MLTKFNKNDKIIIDKLIADGNDLICDGRGWWINDLCFESFKNFMIYLKKIS